jgi:hypothetical protein
VIADVFPPPFCPTPCLFIIQIYDITKFIEDTNFDLIYYVKT